MIKPLLRTIPTLSGNVKLACTLLDYTPINEDNTLWEANIRGARILPISSQLYQKEIKANLLTSTWEYDLQNFYRAYSDTFFKSCFTHDKEDMLMIDKHNNQDVRDTDFEWGVKRISYQKNGDQFAFFAPIYIDNSNDIPAYFDIKAKISTGPYFVYKTLRVHLADNTQNKKSYIYNYIKNYTDKLDKDVVFCMPLTNQATYYGIDLQHGGFVKAVDNMTDRLYRKQNTIHNFDATIAGGFERNKVAMKQILPLCFYFNLNNILTEPEQIRYRNCFVEFSGEYYNKYDKNIQLYDFSNDYMQYAEQILGMDDITGTLYWKKGSIDNIMNVGFPSLAESRYINYEYANKLSPRFCRWKLRYSDDEHPYIINNSWAFSINQNSNYKYGQFPTSFYPLEMLADYIHLGNDYFYNLLFPLGDTAKEDAGRNAYHTFGVKYPAPEYDENGNEIPVNENDLFRPYEHIIGDYKSIIESYVSNWFEVIRNMDDSIFAEAGLWRDTDGSCVYYNGVLYDLQNAYDMVPKPGHIDKFAVLLTTDFEVFDENRINELSFSDMSLHRNATNTVSSPNCQANSNIFTNSERYDKNFLWENTEYEYSGYQDELKFGEIFEKSEDNTGHYIDLNDTSYLISYIDSDGETVYTYGELPIDYWQLNKYYDKQNVDEIISRIKGLLPKDKKVTSHTYSVDAEDKQHIVGFSPEDYVKLFAYHIENELTYISTYIESYTLPDAFYHVPIYNSWRFTYDRVDNKQTYMMNLSEPKQVPSNYTYIDQILHNSIYVHSSVEGRTNHKRSWSRVEDIEFYNVFNPEYNESTYGNSIHVNYSYNLVPASYITGATDYFAYSYIYDYVKSVQTYVDDRNNLLNNDPYYKGDLYYTYYNVDDIFNQSYIVRWDNEDIKTYHPAAHLMGACMSLINSVRKNVDTFVFDNKIPEYEYHPVKSVRGTEYDGCIFEKRTEMSNRFYGDMIPEEYKDRDMDVLWVDEYNLERCLMAGFTDYCKNHDLYYMVGDDGDWHITDKEGNELGIDDLEYPWNTMKIEQFQKRNFVIPEEDCKEMYVKFLNKQHVFYYDIELYKFDNKTAPYKDWSKSWYKTLYAAEKRWYYEDGILKVSMIYTPLEKLIVDNENEIPSFFDFYNNKLSYHRTHKTFSLINYPHEFELCFKKRMYRVDKRLWDSTNMGGNVDMYRDYYFYKLQSGVANDEEMLNVNKVEYLGNDPFTNPIPELDITHRNGYWGVNENGEHVYIKFGTSSKLHFPDTYEVDEYGTPDAEKEIDGEPIQIKDVVRDIDTMLVPVFDDVFIQDADEAVIYAHYALHDISTSNIVGPLNTETGERELKETNYRLSKNNKHFMMSITDGERERYNFLTTYDVYDKCFTKLETPEGYDYLGLQKYGLNTYYSKEDGLIYGWYLIKSSFNNTTNTFNIVAYKDGDRVDNVRYVPMVNGINIVQYPEYVTLIYKSLLPFMNQNPLSSMADINTILYPNTYSLLLEYNSSLANNNNHSTETNILYNRNALKTIALLRYFHAMTPLILPTSNIPREWRLKLKDVKKQLLDTGKYISIGDAPIYVTDVHINTFKPRAVYTSSLNQKDVADYNNKIEDYTPLEYKHYNVSRMVNLTEMFKINTNRQFTYEQLKKAEEYDNVLNIFKNYINNNRRTKYNDDELIFLFNKYNVGFNSIPVGLNVYGDEKLYELEYIFTLL